MSPDEFPNAEDAILYDGCEIKCAEDEILLADPRNGGSWNCAPTSAETDSKIVLCPGKFNTGWIGNKLETKSQVVCPECICTGGPEDCPIGECECDGQLRVNHDCTYARFGDISFPI